MKHDGDETRIAHPDRPCPRCGKREQCSADDLGWCHQCQHDHARREADMNATAVWVCDGACQRQAVPA